ncbi:hypothetical protein Golob_002253 [Gossypium lobatum]|uniref:Uncharacterized protein n=1 Tax=Gossypium lobatum TaxID=34289 RepID=A0A7J8N4U4_9ROSI|nr:hypothetical protein [Gossypium lobatum]
MALSQLPFMLQIVLGYGRMLVTFGMRYGMRLSGMLVALGSTNLVLNRLISIF